MNHGSPERPPEPTATIRMSVLGRLLEFRVVLPAGSVGPETLMPLLHRLCDELIGATMTEVQARGHRVSCSSGCAACCRKLPALAPAEARSLATLIASLPEERRSGIHERFRSVRGQLEAVGLWAELFPGRLLTVEEFSRAGRRYFGQYFACPFLENEQCTIYEQRPLACRECLVTSPARHCFPDSAVRSVEQVNLPAAVSATLATLDQPDGTPRFVPLPCVPDWAASSHPAPPPRPAVDILQDILQRLNTPAASPP